MFRYLTVVALVTLLLTLTSCGDATSPIEPAQLGGERAVGCEPPPPPPPICGEMEVCLMAGQHTEVGSTIVTYDDDCLVVDFEVDPEWTIAITHIAVSDTFEGLPQNKAGNPKIGHFPYEAGECIDINQWDIECGVTQLYVAAHAVVINGMGVAQTAWGCGEDFGKSWAMYFMVTIECCEKDLPELPADTVCFKVGYPGLNSYVDTMFTTVPSGFDWLIDGWDMNGYWLGWCADKANYITPGTVYCEVMLYSSYDSANWPADPRFNIDWDLINYILNNKQGTKDDVQNAIWWFSNNITPPPGPAQDMVADAMANGVGFFPGPGQWFAVICYIGPENQLTIFEVDP